MIAPALQALERGLRGLLKGIDAGASRTYSTPRRLAVVIDDVGVGRPVNEKLVTGPPAQAAQRDGQWTKAAQGFARGKGVSVDDLQIVDVKGRQVVAATVRQGGEQTVDLVAAGLEKLILGLPFKRSMRWGSGAVRWGRPLHQVVAVFGGERIPATVAGIETTAAVVGHRRADQTPVPVSDAASYVEGLRGRWVLADRAERQAVIVRGLQELAADASVDLDLDKRLLEEVTDLVEWPMPIAARFDEQLLELPDRLLEESMRVHQRYFPTFSGGALTPMFLIVSNNPTGDAALIATGNQRVLAARFHDAHFFLNEDKKVSLAEHGADLARMRWVRGLGTVEDKQARVSALAGVLAERLDLDPDAARRAGALCKCDLLSNMVGEFPELQGHMGRLYAESEGQPAAVASAIEEHYWPRFSGDRTPPSAAGQAVALADRMDTLVGCFSIGLKPKGSADPQGLRRAAIGVNAILMDAGLRVSWSELITLTTPAFADSKTADDADTALLAFLRSRLRASFQGSGFRTDHVDAVLNAGGDEPVALLARLQALQALSQTPDFAPLMEALKRVLNISKDHTTSDYDAAALEHPSEIALSDAIVGASAQVQASVDALDIGDALRTIAALKPTIDAFFEGVFVMAEDPALRAARLGLLRRVAELFLSVADFRAISTD
jgi:glycyl-tRNA synthetase beta chain